MAQRLEWIEYLLIDVGGDKDPNVRKYHPFLKAVIDQAKAKEITGKQASNYIEAIIPSVLQEANEKYRINNLFQAIVNYSKKIV
jgi:hypothetical protein